MQQMKNQVTGGEIVGRVLKNEASSQQRFKVMITGKKEERMELRDWKLKGGMGKMTGI